MLNDQYGRQVSVGDTVTIQGSLVDLLDDPNYINCTVLLDRSMPPSGIETRVDLNTQQVVKNGPGIPLVPPIPLLSSRLAAERAIRKHAIDEVITKLAQIKLIVRQLSGQQSGQDWTNFSNL